MLYVRHNGASVVTGTRSHWKKPVIYRTLADSSHQEIRPSSDPLQTTPSQEVGGCRLCIRDPLETTSSLCWGGSVRSHNAPAFR
jgi:hypothetical protein